MFGLYPAGPQWVRRFVSSISAAEVRHLLVEVASFTAGALMEPFGKERGAVIASHQGFLVMVDTGLHGTELVVAPDVQLQSLLWSMNSGFGGQWSNREIKLLTGHGGWDDLLKDTSQKLASISKIVEQAIDGLLVKQQAPVSQATSQQPAESDTFGGEPWDPSSYAHLMAMTGSDAACVH
jgi:hypothetical protein